MAGKHEPPTKTSFYLSLGASTLRAIIVAAFLAAGVLGLMRFFDSNPSEDVTQPSPARSPSPAASPTPATPRTTTPPAPTTSPPVENVIVKVLNGTTTTGLAGSVTEILQEAGYTAQEPGNAEATDLTTLFYRADSQPAAQGIQQRFFQTARLEPAPDDFPQDVNVVVVLGADYNPT
jgi:hypothetical protein